jgi:hypothetical protein
MIFIQRPISLGLLIATVLLLIIVALPRSAASVKRPSRKTDLIEAKSAALGDLEGLSPQQPAATFSPTMDHARTKCGLDLGQWTNRNLSSCPAVSRHCSGASFSRHSAIIFQDRAVVPGSVSYEGSTGESLTTFAAAIFIAPYFFLSALGGEIADRYDKALVAQRIKLVEIGVAMIAVAGFAFHLILVLFVALFLFGVLGAVRADQIRHLA